MKPLQNVTLIDLVLVACYMSLGYFFYQWAIAPEPNYVEAAKDAWTTAWSLSGFYFIHRFFIGKQ